MHFRLFLETAPDDDVIRAALQARREEGVECARFGDCKAVSQRAVTLLQAKGVPAKLVHGQFVADPDDDLHFDHTWIKIGNDILDPTVDQFFSPLDFDLVTRVPGVYYSALDGDQSLKSRYVKSGDYFRDSR